MKKRTLVVGASDNPTRYAYKAATMLNEYGHPIELLGLKTGQVAGAAIQRGEPDLDSIDTVTLYVGTRNQPPLYDYLLKLKPKRIIFNPGTENPEFAQKARQQGIETVQGCTLVMLATGQF
ncbi:CoA-binding protein [Cytophagaceae bacterium YF14B1]|uniref:CoA-binding protein n=1 Tax=Xanthocytophaga flava TaxID=3048013 RepID=A0AAE3U9F3_9BACT|nr:CoA-binding protein [Xanthocytophaga flavus]MDJ1483617.1 CoA-binding protein [Xanthocytophaga flavus]